jgi:hypothetical protein
MKTTTTTIEGTVSAFEPGQFITIEQPDHQTVRYTITKESQLPQDLTVGKTVTVRTYEQRYHVRAPGHGHQDQTKTETASVRHLEARKSGPADRLFMSENGVT